MTIDRRSVHSSRSAPNRVPLLTRRSEDDYEYEHEYDYDSNGTSRRKIGETARALLLPKCNWVGDSAPFTGFPRSGLGPALTPGERDVGRLARPVHGPSRRLAYSQSGPLKPNSENARERASETITRPEGRAYNRCAERPVNGPGESHHVPAEPDQSASTGRSCPPRCGSLPCADGRRAGRIHPRDRTELPR